MRDKSFRRKQEAKHFSKRIKFYSMYEKNAQFCELRKRKEPIDIDEFKEEKWVNKLKNGDVKVHYMDKWDKKHCSKLRRNFQKKVDYPLKTRRWYERKHVNPQVPGYNRDYVEEI